MEIITLKELRNKLAVGDDNSWYISVGLARGVISQIQVYPDSLYYELCDNENAMIKWKYDVKTRRNILFPG